MPDIVDMQDYTMATNADEDGIYLHYCFKRLVKLEFNEWPGFR